MGLKKPRASKVSVLTVFILLTGVAVSPLMGTSSAEDVVDGCEQVLPPTGDASPNSAASLEVCLTVQIEDLGLPPLEEVKEPDFIGPVMYRAFQSKLFTQVKVAGENVVSDERDFLALHGPPPTFCDQGPFEHEPVEGVLWYSVYFGPCGDEVLHLREAVDSDPLAQEFCRNEATVILETRGDFPATGKTEIGPHEVVLPC